MIYTIFMITKLREREGAVLLPHLPWICTCASCSKLYGVQTILPGGGWEGNISHVFIAEFPTLAERQAEAWSLELIPYWRVPWTPEHVPIVSLSRWNDLHYSWMCNHTCQPCTMEMNVEFGGKINKSATINFILWTSWSLLYKWKTLWGYFWYRSFWSGPLSPPCYYLNATRKVLAYWV